MELAKTIASKGLEKRSVRILLEVGLGLGLLYNAANNPENSTNAEFALTFVGGVLLYASIIETIRGFIVLIYDLTHDE